MSLTSAELEICNQALALIGQKEIDSTDTSTADTGTAGNPYNKCDLIYVQTRNALLRWFEWNFAMARLSLVDDWTTDTAYTTDQYVWVDSELFKCNTAHTSDTWTSNYLTFDGEYLTFDGEYLTDDRVTFYWTIVDDRPETYWSYRYALPADFDRFKKRWLYENERYFTIEDNSILANLEELNINYVKIVSDTTSFDWLFTEVLIYELAIKLTYSLMGTSYATQALRKELEANKQRKLKKAIATCINEKDQSGRYNWTTARFTSSVE